jgi:hypothetical protein
VAVIRQITGSGGSPENPLRSCGSLTSVTNSLEASSSLVFFDRHRASLRFWSWIEDSVRMDENSPYVISTEGVEEVDDIEALR